MKRRRFTNPLRRFLRKIAPSATTGCWNWRGTRLPKGYGVFDDHGKVYAHRWAYERFRGPIPAHLQIDHLCRNKSCANPWHLEPVTGRENMIRGRTVTGLNALKTRCPRGHEYNASNTVRRGHSRRCRICDRERQRVGWTP